MINFNPNNIRIELVRDMDTAMTFLQWIKDVPDQLIALDVETDGLDWYDGRLRLVQFGTLTEGWAVPFEDFRHLVIEALAILNDRGKVFVGHNFKFDLHWIERNTGWLPRDWAYVHDTMNMAAVLNSSGAKDLKTLSEFYVWDGAKGGQKALHDDMKKYGWTWGTVPVHLPSYWIYGVLDTILTANLFYVLYDKCVRAETLEAYRTEMSAFPVLYKMERKGMLLDREHCVEKRDTLVTRAREIEAEVAQYGVNNIQSTSQIALALIDAGVELTETTGSGKWKMDRETFDIIAATNDHPLVKLIQEYRSATKMASTYYDNFLKYQRSDGRCHPQYNAVVARTGRMSASDPAILTVPRPGTNADVRNSFVAPDGHVLISTDFNNVEARIFAHFAREQGMIDAFRAGVDLHCYTAKEIFRLDEMPSKDDPRRQIAKNTLFCTLFGGGAAKVAVTAGIPLEEGQRSIKGLYTAFPGIKEFQQTSTMIATDNLKAHGQAFIRGVDGRILAMVETDDRYYAFTNWQIQSAANVVLKRRLAVIDAMGLADYIIAAIHDEVVAEIPEEFEPEYKVLIKEAMEDPYSFAVPIVSSTGDSAVRWGDAK
jgi:DNA polymerase-1